MKREVILCWIGGRMTALKKGIIFLGLLGLCVLINRHYKPDMTVLYPDNCSFTFDSHFSRATRLEIKSFIDAAYKKSKNPCNLLPSIEREFVMIRSIVIDMQNPEQLNFTIQSYHPLFLLNDSLIVCQQGRLFEKHIFAHDVVRNLENISYQGSLHKKDIDRLMKFVALVPDHIFKEFSIRWLDKNNVWLDQKEGQDLSLLVGYALPPTATDIAECRNLRGQVVDKPSKDKRGKPCKNNTTWVCDLRFDQQIVLFSTNKGG